MDFFRKMLRVVVNGDKATILTATVDGVLECYVEPVLLYACGQAG